MTTSRYSPSNSSVQLCGLSAIVICTFCLLWTKVQKHILLVISLQFALEDGHFIAALACAECIAFMSGPVNFQCFLGDKAFVNMSAICLSVDMYLRKKSFATVTACRSALSGTSMCLTFWCAHGFSIHLIVLLLSSHTCILFVGESVRFGLNAAINFRSHCA